MKCKQHSFSRDPRACGVDLERLCGYSRPQPAFCMWWSRTHTLRGGGEKPATLPPYVRTTSHARAVAPVLLSPLGGAYCGRRPARAAVEQASLGEEKREGIGVGGGVLTRRVTPKPTSEKPARGETTGARRYTLIFEQRIFYILYIVCVRVCASGGFLS